MSRNGTFRTGMKNLTSRPVDVLNAGRRPTTSSVGLGIGAPGSRTVTDVNGSLRAGAGGGTSRVMSSHHPKLVPTSRTCPAS